MKPKLYHQCGHNTNWNIDSFEKDKCGAGLIFSPVHKKRADIEKYDAKVKMQSFFDPQYYLPNSQKTKLQTYSFFPEVIAGGFSTEDFSLVASESAKRCIDFQLANKFSHIVIPARYYEQMITDYIERQNACTVLPFLKEITRQKVKKPVLLTLPLTPHMIMDESYRTNLLNWVTSFPEISGVYVFSSNEGNEKQIKSEKFLYAYLEFLQALRNVDLEVVVGYCNTESLLYSLVDGCSIAIGSFENTRMFSTDKFIVPEDDEKRRGPKPRIFLPGLLNWIQFGQAKTIKEDAPEIWDELYVPNTYSDQALKLAIEPTFNQPQLYKSHFQVYAAMITPLFGLDAIGRYKAIRSKLKHALELYAQIEEIPVDLEKHGKGDHIQAWLDTINKFYTNYLKVV